MTEPISRAGQWYIAQGGRVAHWVNVDHNRRGGQFHAWDAACPYRGWEDARPAPTSTRRCPACERQMQRWHRQGKLPAEETPDV